MHHAALVDEVAGCSVIFSVHFFARTVGGTRNGALCRAPLDLLYTEMIEGNSGSLPFVALLISAVASGRWRMVSISS